MDSKRERAFSFFFSCFQYCGNFTRKGIALNCSAELWDQWQLRNNSLDSFDLSWPTEVAAKFLYLHLIIIIVRFCFGPQERHILVKDKTREFIYTGIQEYIVCLSAKIVSLSFASRLSRCRPSSVHPKFGNPTQHCTRWHCNVVAHTRSAIVKKYNRIMVPCL